MTLILFLPNEVKAFTTGSIYSKWGTGDNNFTGSITETNNQIGTRMIQLGNPITIECATNYCFATFETEILMYGQLDSSNIWNQNIFIQTLVNKNNQNEWNICEVSNGLTTCMIKNTYKITHIEIKYRNYGLNETISYHIDMNNGTIFNSPSEAEQQLNNIQQQQQTNWNNFNNQDISEQDQTPPDTTTIDNVQQQESQQISNISDAIDQIVKSQFDLTDFSLTFAWIWQTIMYLFTTHTILMSTMTIVLSLGFIKTIFGR